MTTEHSTYTYEYGAQETVTLSRGRLTPHGHALLKINYSDGRTADCYVNTAWLRGRLDDLGELRPATLDADEGVRHDGDYWHARWAEQCERAEKAERLRAAAQFEAATLRADRDAAEEERDEVIDEAAKWQADALRRAQERDEARATIDALREEAHACDVHNGVVIPGPRPLTADAISEAEWDQIAARAWEYWEGHAIFNSHGLKRMMQFALTEPPARPEGAERWEDWLIEAMPHESMPDEDIALLADRIAQRLNEERS